MPLTCFSLPVKGLILCLSVLALLGPAASAQTAVDVRAERYLDAYMMNNDGERLEKAGNLEAARRKFVEAQQIFQSLSQAYPDWEVNMLAMRQRKVTDSISRVEAALSRPAPQPTPSPSLPTASLPPPNGSGMPSAAPVPSAPAGNALGGPPAVGSWGQDGTSGGSANAAAEVPSLMNFLQQYEQAYKNKISDLERRNLEMEGSLSKWQQWYQWASGEIKSARAEQGELSARSEMMEQSVLQLQRELEAGRASQSDMDALLKQKAALEAEKQQAAQRLSAAEAKAAEASAQLAQASAQLASVTEQRDQARQERDQLKQQNAGMQEELAELRKSTGGEELKKLMAENERLKGDLEAAKQQVVELQQSVTQKDEQIAMLQGELSTIQDQVAQLQQENTQYQTQVSELTAQLKELGEMPAVDGEEVVDPQLAAENEMLRGIILRQLRNQARQQQAKALVLDELKELEDASEDLIDQVRELGQERVTLSPQEERLFTDPQIRKMFREGDSSMQATLIASSSSESPAEGEAAKPAAPSVAITVESLVQQGNDALQSQDYSDARKAYEEALRADPKNASALIGLGIAHQRSGDLEDAEVALKKCLAYEPDNANAYFTLGTTLFKANRMNDSMAAFENCLKHNRKEARAHHYLGIIASRLTLTQRAEREFRTTLAIDPTFAEAHFNLAVLYIGWSPPQWEKAREEYDEAVAKGVDPDTDMEKLLNSRVSAN